MIRILIIDDDPNRLELLRSSIEARGWQCLTIQVDSIDSAMANLDTIVGDKEDMFSATILDIMLGNGEEYGGIELFEKADLLYDRSRFGQLVVMSGKEFGDDIVSAFVKKYDAIRRAGPLKSNVGRLLDELNRRF